MLHVLAARQDLQQGLGELGIHEDDGGLGLGQPELGAVLTQSGVDGHHLHAASPRGESSTHPVHLRLGIDHHPRLLLRPLQGHQRRGQVLDPVRVLLEGQPGVLVRQLELLEPIHLVLLHELPPPHGVGLGKPLAGVVNAFPSGALPRGWLVLQGKGLLTIRTHGHVLTVPERHSVPLHLGSLINHSELPVGRRVIPALGAQGGSHDCGGM
mmetsp:Transcript_45747/g.99353  ORF Transcript_45747/g.99353 Transcript_45747/m.99353 type:complete len:211 (+) Transcript_45747:1780-2412(+)